MRNPPRIRRLVGTVVVTATLVVVFVLIPAWTATGNTALLHSATLEDTPCSPLRVPETLPDSSVIRHFEEWSMEDMAEFWKSLMGWLTEGLEEWNDEWYEEWDEEWEEEWSEPWMDFDDLGALLSEFLGFISASETQYAQRDGGVWRGNSWLVESVLFTSRDFAEALFEYVLLEGYIWDDYTERIIAHRTPGSVKQSSSEYPAEFRQVTGTSLSHIAATESGDLLFLIGCNLVGLECLRGPYDEGETVAMLIEIAKLIHSLNGGPEVQPQLELTVEEIARKYLPNLMQLECDIEAGNGIEWVAYHVERQDTLARIEYSVVFADEDHPDPLVDAAYDIKRGATDIETFYVVVDLQTDEITELAFHYPYRSTCPAEILGFLDCLTGAGCGTWYGGQGYGVAVPLHYCRIFEGEESANEFGFSDGRPNVYIATWNHLFSSREPTGLPTGCVQWRKFTHETVRLVERSRAELEETRGLESSTGTGLADSPWPMFQYDPQHTGRSPFNGPEYPGIKWCFTGIEERSHSYPSVGPDGTIYVGSDEGNLYAINPDGTEKWHFTTGGYIDSSPAIAKDGTIYVGSWDSQFYGINPDGSLKWRFATDGRIKRSPSISEDGVIYFPSEDGKLYALYPDGTLKWSLPTVNADIISSPALGFDGTIYVQAWLNSGQVALCAIDPEGTLRWSFTDGYLGSSFDIGIAPSIGADGTILYLADRAQVNAIRPDGSLKWSFVADTDQLPYDRDFNASPSLGADGTIFIGSNLGELYAINPDGSLKWRFNTEGGSLNSSPVIGADGTIYVSLHCGLSAINPNGTLKWSAFEGDEPCYYPVIGGDKVIYAVGGATGLYAIVEASARGPWRFQTEDLVVSSPAIGVDGAIYVSSGDSVYAINPDSTQRWRFQTEDIMDSSPVIGADGAIYLGSDHGYVYAINPDGTQRWRFNTGDFVEFAPAIGADGTIYVGSHDGFLYAIHPDGTKRWQFQVGSVCSSPAIGADGTIYVSSHDGFLYAIHPDGTKRWQFQVGSVWSSPAIGADDTIYVNSYDGYLCAVRPDGTQKWRVQTKGKGHAGSSPAIGVDGTIYVGSGNALYAILPSGKEEWRFQTEGHVQPSPAIGADGTIYAASDRGYLYALAPDGTQKWRLEPGVSYSSPAVGEDGTLYIGCHQGCLYALKTESKGLADSPWPMFRHDSRHTGRAAAADGVSTPESIYPIYDFPLALYGGDIPVQVGSGAIMVALDELNESFTVDAEGNIHLKYLDVFRVLATGSTTLAITDMSTGVGHSTEMLFSLPEGGQFDFLKEARHEWITGFLGGEGSESAWEGAVTFPTSLYESLRLSWAVEKANLDDFYQGLDEALKLLQFVYLLMDPDVKGYLEGRIQEAKRSGRSGELRAVYREIARVLDTMGASREVAIQIPDISLDMNYNFMLGTVEIPYEIDLFKDEEIRLWVTIDESQDFLDPGGVILHIQTNVFDLDKFSEIIKMSLEVGSLEIDLALDLIGVVGLAAGQAVDETAEFILTLKDLGIWALKSVVSFGSVFLDYRADFAVSLVQEREPGSPESLEELAELLRDQKDTYLFYEEINHLLLFDTFVGPHFRLPPVKPIHKLFSHLSDDLPSLPGIYVGLHISEEIVKPLEYKRLLTEIKSRLEAKVDFTLEVECQSDLFQELNFNFKEEDVDWLFDTGTIERPEVLLKVEEVSTDDLLSKMYGVGEVAGEVAADLGGILVGKFVELVLPSLIDTSAKKVTEKLVAEIAMKVGEDIAGMIYSFIFGTVYDLIFDSAVEGIQDALPELPNIDLYILRLGTSILAVPSNLISNNQISLPLGFDTTIALPGEPFPTIMSCTIKCGLSLEIDLSESGTEQKGNMLWVLAQNLTGVDLDPPVFAGLKNATAGDGEVSLSWEEAVDVSPPITYKVYMATESGEQDFSSPIYVTEGTNCTITGLDNLQSYYFIVRAQDEQGHEDENAGEKVATPLPLIPFVGELSWAITLASHADLHLYDQQGRHVGKNYDTAQIEEEVPNASFELKADGRQLIEVSNYESGRYRIELVGTSNGDYTLTSEARQGGQIVSSRTVLGTIRRGEEKTSSAFAVVPQGRLLSVFVEPPLVRPHGLIAKPGHSSVSLSWPAYKEAGFDVAGYNVYRSERSTTGYKKVNEAVLQNRGFRDTEAVKETEYTYVITAVDASGHETGYSRAVHVMPGLERSLGAGVIIAIIVGTLSCLTAGFLVFRFLRSRYYI